MISSIVSISRALRERQNFFATASVVRAACFFLCDFFPALLASDDISARLSPARPATTFIAIFTALIDEIASGINENRKGLHKLIKMCFEGKVERILIEYKDRLARFGYEYLDAIFKNLEITVEVVETKEKKYEEELAEDIMKILTCYSARFYGRRGGRKKKNTAENEPVESNGI